MQNKENHTNSIITELLEKGIANIQIENREGKALELHHPENIQIIGAIDSPSRWMTSRHGLFEPKKSFTYVDRDNRTIKSYINEQSVVGCHEITGKLELSKEFIELGINSDKKYSPIDLANILKLRRSIFPKKGDHAIIVNTLRNIKAKINKQIEDLNDQKGNTTKHFEQTVESNMPDQFEIEIPLLKGEKKVTFYLNVILEAHSGCDIVCYLESIDAAEHIDEISEIRINEEVEKIKDFTTIIEK